MPRSGRLHEDPLADVAARRCDLRKLVEEGEPAEVDRRHVAADAETALRVQAEGLRQQAADELVFSFL
jgi:hypothetical protein